MVLVMLCPAASPRRARQEVFIATWDARCDFFFPGKPPQGSPGLSSAGEGSHQVSMPHGNLWESSTSEAASGPLSIPDCSLCSRGPAHPLPSCSRNITWVGVGETLCLSAQQPWKYLVLLFQEPDFRFLAQTHHSFFWSSEDKCQ